MAGKDLAIKITATDGASKTFQAIGSSAETMGKRVDDAGTKGASSMKKWKEAGTALGASFAAVSILSSKIDGAAQASTARMTTAFTNVGLSVDDFKDKISDLTGTGLKLAFDDEDVQDSLAKLITTTGDAEKAMRDVGIAEDVARAQGISLAAATNLVNMAEAGRFRGLQQLGIVLGANATTEEAIAALQGRVAGQAQAYSETTAASYDRIKNAAENYLEAVGGFVNANGQVLLAVGGLATAAAPAAEGIKAVSLAMKESAIAGVALDLALGPVGLALGVIAAGVAIYELSQRESDAEKATKALKGATDEYTASIAANTTALVNAGAYDQVQQTKDYLDIWINNGKIAADRITELAAAKDRLDQDAALGGTREVPVWQAMVDGGFITEYTAQVLAANDANADGRISADEYTAAQVYLHKGFELTTTQAAKLTDELKAVDQAASNPDLYGAQMAKDADQIIRDLTNGVIGYDEAASKLKDLPLDPKYNIALAQQNKLTEDATHVITDQVAAQIALNESLYGGVDALAANKDLAEQSVAMGKAHTNSLQDIAKGSEAAAGSTEDFAGELKNLNAELSATNAASNAYDMVVGFTDGMVKGIQTSKEWTDSISGALGTDFMPNGDPSAVLKLLDEKKIDTEDYNEVLKAQTSIYEDNARAQEAAQIIQIKQADVIAAGSDATADYLVALSKQDELQQSISLAYADPAQAQHIQDIADMAAGYSDMNASQKEAFEQTVTSAAALDPALAAVLQSLGLIESTTENSTGWKLTTETTETQSAMDTVVSTLQQIADLLAQAFNLDVTTTFDDGGFWDAYNALPNSKAINVYTVSGSYGPDANVGNSAIGGAQHFATGGMVHLAEIGPEMLRYPSGQIGMAYHEGNYMIPNNTMVSTANATAHDLKGSGGKPSLHLQGCTFYITPPTADIHDAISNSLLRGGM